MFNIPSRYHLIFLIEVLLCIGGVLVLSWFFSLQQDKLVMHLDERVEAERTELLTAAGVADRGEAGEKADAIIADCGSRGQFEDLLGRLHTLSRSDLERASALFEACGDYYAIRKSVGVLLFEEHLATFEEAVNLRHKMANDDPYTEVADVWRRIVELESKRAELFREQVELQRDIINELLVSGSAATINERMTRARQVTELFSVQDKQIDALRQEEAEKWSRARK